MVFLLLFHSSILISHHTLLTTQQDYLTMPRMKDIDDILDAALDELEDDSDDGNSDIDEADQNNSTRKKGENMSQDAQHTQRPVFGPPRPPFMMSSDPNIAPAMSEEEEAVSQMMRQMENLFPSEDFGKDGNTHVNLSNGGNGDGNGDGNGNDNEKNVSNKRTDKSGTKSPDMNEAVNELLRKLSKGEEMNEGSFEGFGDEMTDEMRNEFESTMKGIGPSPLNGDEEDAMGNVVDGMMKQLLSREFMYEPMKDICARFPKWLAENKDKLTPEDYEK